MQQIVALYMTAKFHLLFSDPSAGKIMNTVTETALCHLVVCVDEVLHLKEGKEYSAVISENTSIGHMNLSSSLIC